MCSLQCDWPASSKSYKLLGPLGCGYFGIVWKAEVSEGTHIREHVAIKKIDLERYGDQKIEEIRKNMLLLNLLDHPNILSYKIAFSHKQELWLVFELMEGGSIEKIMQTMYPDGLKDQALIATILKETLLGLKYLHQNSQIHRDIKGGNILVSLTGSPKLADFGSAKRFADVNADSHLSVGFCYTTEWTAPEVFAHGAYNSKVDIWSVGCVVVEMMTGKLPWAEQKFTSRERAMFFIGSQPEIPAIPKKLSPQGQDFLLRCLQRDPVKRASAVELLEHEWIRAA